MTSVVKRYLENISQAFFFKNAYFGALLLALFYVFNPDLFVCGALASLICFTFTERQVYPKLLKDAGLVTLNGLFFGIAMASLFRFSVPFLGVLILGALTIPFLTQAVFEVTQHWRLSPLITPYILGAWAICLCPRGNALIDNPMGWWTPATFVPRDPFFQEPVGRALLALGESMGRLLFISDARFGALLLVLITAFSLRKGIYFLAGTAMALAAACLFAPASATSYFGLYSYSAGLIGLGLASSPEKLSSQRILFFCAVSSVLTLSLHQLLSMLTLPTLSLPYVLTFWLAALSRQPRVAIAWKSAHATRASAQINHGTHQTRSVFNDADAVEETERVA